MNPHPMNSRGLGSRRRPALGLLLAHGISTAGTSMSFLAIPWFVMAATGSATDMGLVTLAEMLPYVLMLAAGGPLVDSLGAARTSVATDVVAALSMGAIPLAQVAGFLNLPFIALCVCAAGTARGAGDVARRVLLPQVADEAKLPIDRAGGLFDGVGRLAGLLGAPLAGAIVAFASAPAAVAADAASFAASALIVASTAGRGSWRRSVARPGAHQREKYLETIGKGLRWLAADPLLLAIASLVLVTNFLDQAYFSVLLPLWTRKTLGSPLALGSITMAFGAGAVAGNVLMAALSPRLPRRLPFALCFLACGAPRFIVLAFSSSLPPILAVALVAGLGAGGINPALDAAQYERIPPDYHARVLGAMSAIGWAGVPFGGLAGGLLADSLGLGASFLVLGALYLVATLLPFVLPVWRQMERPALPCPELLP